jgi:tRNA/tmRNA/rRNA uracil-C5-methylase (TrmA/RlmC/RlmD family)
MEDGVKREDMEAIETLLRNTKAKIDEMDPDQAVKKDHLDAVELLVLETRNSVNELTTHLEDVSKQDNINTVEALVRNILSGLEDLKEKSLADKDEHLEKVTKTDVEAVEAVCLDIKAAFDQIWLLRTM